MSVCEPLVCVVCGSQSSKVSRPPSRETWTYTSWSVAVVKVFYTHHSHIKAKGNMSSPCLEIFSSFSSFHWRQVQRSPLFSFPDSHPIHHYVSWSSLTFYTLISFFTSQFSLFTLSFTSHIILCIWLPLQSPWAWGPQKGIQAGLLLSTLHIIVRLTISLSSSLCSDVSGKNKPLSYLHSPEAWQIYSSAVKPLSSALLKRKAQSVKGARCWRACRTSHCATTTLPRRVCEKYHSSLSSRQASTCLLCVAVAVRVHVNSLITFRSGGFWSWIFSTSDRAHPKQLGYAILSFLQCTEE